MPVQRHERTAFYHLPVHCPFCGKPVQNITNEEPVIKVCPHTLYIAHDFGFDHLSPRAEQALVDLTYAVTPEDELIAVDTADGGNEFPGNDEVTDLIAFPTPLRSPPMLAHPMGRVRTAASPPPKTNSTLPAVGVGKRSCRLRRQVREPLGSSPVLMVSRASHGRRPLSVRSQSAALSNRAVGNPPPQTLPCLIRQRRRLQLNRTESNKYKCQRSCNPQVLGSSRSGGTKG